MNDNGDDFCDTWNSLVVTIMTLNDNGDDGFLKCAMMTN